MNSGEHVRNIPSEQDQPFNTADQPPVTCSTLDEVAKIDIGTHLTGAEVAASGNRPASKEPEPDTHVSNAPVPAHRERSTSVRQLDEGEFAHERGDALAGFVVEPIYDVLELPTQAADVTIGTAPVSDDVKQVQRIVHRHYAGMRLSDEGEGETLEDAEEGEGNSPASSLAELTEHIQPSGLIKYSDVAVHDRYASEFTDAELYEPNTGNYTSEAARRLVAKLVRRQDVPSDQVIAYVRQLHDAPAENLIIDPTALDVVIYGKPANQLEADSIPERHDLERRYPHDKPWINRSSAYWTPYETIKLAAHHVNPSPGQKIIDLGAGYGRLPIYMGMNYPEVTFIGIEMVRERARIAEQTRQRHGLENVKITHGNVLSTDFSSADIIFTYYPFTDETGKKVMEQIRQNAKNRAAAGEEPLTIIAHFGSLSDNISYREQPWLKQVTFGMIEDESHRSGLSFYQSVPDLDAYEKGPDDRVFKLVLREETGQQEIEPDQIRQIVQAIHGVPLDGFNVSTQMLDELLFGARLPDLEASQVPYLEELKQRHPGESVFDGRREGVWTPYQDIKEVVTTLNPGKGKKIGDLGCGFGRFLMYGAEVTEADYTGYELVRERAEIADMTRKRLGLKNVHIVNGNVIEQELGDLDIIYMYAPFSRATLPKVVNNILAAAIKREADGREPLIIATRSDWHFVRLPWLKELSLGDPTKSQRLSEIRYFQYAPSSERTI